MTVRSKIAEATKTAMREKEAKRLSTLRLINAAIKDQEIALRADAGDEGLGDGDILSILSKMVKQRLESAKAYEEGARFDLAEGEREEIGIIQEFLPKQLDDTETTAAIDAAITKINASSLRDMGAVMGELKAQYTGQMDFSKVGPLVKSRLS